MKTQDMKTTTAPHGISAFSAIGRRIGMAAMAALGVGQLALMAAAAPTTAPASAPATGPPAAPTAGAEAPAPWAWLERWRFNARERTDRGLAALSSDPARAADDLATAARIAPEELRTQLNAGAGAVLAGKPAEGLAPLRKAKEMVDEADATVDETSRATAAETYYQLGTAQLEAGDLDGAIESLRESLRRDPAAADTKHNLELATRRKDKQEEEKRQQQQQQQQQQDQKQNPGQDQQDQPRKQPQQQEPQQPQDQDDSQQNPAQPQQDGQKGEPQAPPPGQQPEPRDEPPKPQPGTEFRPQPGMSKQQAEALLEAVENRERQQRREEAKKRALKNSREEKDW
jgi:Ca-activated chloride channel family protein